MASIAAKTRKQNVTLTSEPELTGASRSLFGEEVCCLGQQRGTIKAALNFMFDGYEGESECSQPHGRGA
ncbi:TPA: CcdB family protein [Serratia fonticola]|uniref:CcdB family protein n=1 Tax=Serratia fonticola TaxID=47917 RepID=UPI002179E438|nr:CcdB family protein [Serratia fonticola]CAI0734769.1 Uncharacterised protein [Serratia fonticola]CAI1703532.1 Uncharacterised protein [Serratia fonticola]